ncbi:hypothetical protein F4774DRAFT_366021 [Daldinia eschscholtzii]|nr:hypothetical protein F4774DRAFT_366021 [Daldinia eschscholtzii]
MRTIDGILSNVNDFVWCPLGCGKGQVHYPGESQPFVFCPNDNGYFCFRHRVAWHQSFTCEQYDALTRNRANQGAEQKLKEEMAQHKARLAAEEAATNLITRLCGGCSRRIMKDGGW